MSLQSEFSLREKPHSVSTNLGTRTNSSSLGGRDIIVIDGKTFRMRVLHKETGEYVRVPPSIWEEVRPKMQEVFDRLRAAAEENGGYKNFRGERVQKITVDMQADPHEVHYTSKHALDSDEEIDEPQIFKLDVSATHRSIYEFARTQFREISKITIGSQRNMPASRETPPEGKPEELGHSVEASCRRMREGETLTTDDLMNYTNHVIKRKYPDACFLEKRVSSPELQGVSGRAPIFTDNELDQEVKASFEKDPTKPLVIYMHHHPHEHYSTMIAKNGRLFLYNPTGTPHQDLDLNAIYQGIYGREASNRDICKYEVNPEMVRIFHTLYETFKTDQEEKNATLRKTIWRTIQTTQDMGVIPVGTTQIALFNILGQVRYNTFHKAIFDAVEKEGVDQDTKIKNMIKIVARDRAGEVDRHFDDAEAISRLSTSLTHQTDDVNCGVFALGFVDYMCDGDNDEDRYYEYLTTRPDPDVLRTFLSQKLAATCGINEQEGEHVEFRGISEHGLSKTLITSIIGLPRFQSPSGSVKGLRPEIDRTRQAMHELALVMKPGMPTQVRPHRFTFVDRDPVDAFLLFASDGSPILQHGTEDTLAFLPKEAALNRVSQSAKVYYNPGLFPDEDEARQAIILPLLSGEAMPESETYKLARRKYIISDNFLIFDEEGRFIPFDSNKIGKTLTAVAPNLRDQRDSYLKEAEPRIRKAHMKTLIKDQMHIFQKEGCKQLVLPAFGCGLFGWNPEEVADSYKEVLQELEKEDYGFDAVHFSLPNAEHYAIFNKVFKEGYTGHVPVYLTKKDATGVIRVLSESDIRWGELNPGNVEAQVGTQLGRFLYSL